MSKKYEKENSRLVLFAAFADEVGGAKGGQHGDASAERSRLVGRFTVAGKTRSNEHRATLAARVLLRRVAALEQTTVIGASESRHAQSEDDS